MKLDGLVPRARDEAFAIGSQGYRDNIVIMSFKGFKYLFCAYIPKLDGLIQSTRDKGFIVVSEDNTAYFGVMSIKAFKYFACIDVP